MPRMSFDCEELLNWWEPTTDVSFIFNFNWKSLQQLREAVTIFLCSRMHKVCQRARIAIAETGCPHLKNILASNPGTPADLLDYLCEVGSRDTLIRIAENPNTSKETLTKLCFHEDCEVRTAVADNVSAPESVYKRLSNDHSTDVRFRLAENPSAPATVLYMLLRDENPYVSHRARQTLSGILTEAVSISTKLMEAETELRPNVVEINTGKKNRFLEELNDLCGGDFFTMEFPYPESKV